MGQDDRLLAALREAEAPAAVLSGERPSTLRRLARAYGLFETVGGTRYFRGEENVVRVALAEQLRRAGLPHRQHAGSPPPLGPAAAAQVRALVQRQAAVVQGAREPGQLLAVLAALELLLIVGARAGLAELEDGRLLADVRALLARPSHALVAAQAHALVERLVGELG
jgi:hypothetical protein